MAHLFEFEAAEVLGVEPGARLEAVRDAYRAKSKKYHPDAGGDTWAFRLVNRAYELMCCSRVASWVVEEEQAEAKATRASASTRPGEPHAERKPFVAADSKTSDHFAEDVRHGAQDEGYSAERLIDVEILVVRQEILNPVEFLTARTEDRNLSCSVSAAWPKAGLEGMTERERDAITDGLNKAFKKAAKACRPLSQNLRREDGAFSGWLTYPSAREAHDAAQSLRAALHEVSLGVKQTTRELVVPRV